MSLGRRQYANNPVIEHHSTIVSIPLTGTIRGLYAEVDAALTAAGVTRRDINGIYISASRGADVLLNTGTVGAVLTGFGIKVSAGTNLFLPINGGIGQISYESTAIADVMIVFG